MNEQRDHGTIAYKDTLLKLAQAPYRCGTKEAAYYRALAHDGEGNAYFIEWHPREPGYDIEKGDDVFDWEHYIVREF